MASALRLERWTAVLGAMLFMVCVGYKAEAGTYWNAEFGVVVSPLPKMTVCVPRPEEHDHGIEILIDAKTRSACIRNSEKYRNFGIFAFYNSSDDIETFEGYVKHWCGQDEERCLPAPKGLGLKSFRSRSGRVNHADGSIEIMILAQSTRAPRRFPSDTRVNYDMHLLTDAAHLKEDVRLFRRFLHTVRFVRPDWEGRMVR